MLLKKIKPVIVFILLLALLIPMLPTTANAAYENTYQNTGNMRDDIIGVALTQVGYREGSNNYTKYGVWYGLSNSPWCGMFVSWCAAQAGIPTSVLKRTGVANPSSFGLSYKSGSEYTPQKGDLFFKKSFSHVGLVYYTEGDYFYTIEGNTSDVSSEGTSVLIRRRKISDFYFSSPSYSGSSSSGCSHNYSVGYEGGHPHKEYKSCSKCGKISYTGNTVSLDSCPACIQAACSHNFGSWTASDDGTHTRVCSKCDLTEKKVHDWKIGEVLKEATCVDEGAQVLKCSVCGTQSEESIPVTNNHTFGDTAYINEIVHQQVCSVCSKQETFAHTPSGNWNHDALYHWTSCADCGGRLTHTEHNFSGGCLLPCDTCGYTQHDGHNFDTEYQYNTDSHWNVCTKCGLSADPVSHVYTTDCDETCNICDYIRTVENEHEYEYIADESGHHQECKNCHGTTAHIQHTADRNAEEWEDVKCIHCAFVLRSSDRHVHTFQNTQHNSTTHWGTCICGENLEPEVHTWDISTGTCSICNASYTAANNETNFLVKLIQNWFNG